MSEKRIAVWVQRFKDRPGLQLQWIDPDTNRRKTRKTSTADPEKAEQARRDLEYELNHGLYQEIARMTWQAFRERFETEHAAGRRPGTQESYKDTLNQFEAICNPARVRSVDVRMVSLFVAGMRKKGMKESTIKMRVQYLKATLAWAVSQRMLAARPKFPIIKPPKKNPKPVPAETYERLYAKAADDQVRAFLGCGWYAGLRISEALQLEWSDTDEAPYVDFSRQRIILPAGFAKAGRDQWVPLDPELRALLEKLPSGDGKVFRFVDSRGKVLDRKAVGARVVKLAAKAGVRMTYHTLRKGFGSRYAAKVPAQVLQKLMRHGHISLTMDYYANVDAAVENAVLGSGRQCNTSRNIGKNAQMGRPRRNDVRAEMAKVNAGERSSDRGRE
jgi:integrase